MSSVIACYPRTDLSVAIECWPLAGGFTISRGSKTQAVVVVAELRDGTAAAAANACPMRATAKLEGVVAAIEAMRPALHAASTAPHCKAMPPGAARNALDCAYWDLNAKKPAAGCTNSPAWRAGTADHRLHDIARFAGRHGGGGGAGGRAAAAQGQARRRRRR